MALPRNLLLIPESVLFDLLAYNLIVFFKVRKEKLDLYFHFPNEKKKRWMLDRL